MHLYALVTAAPAAPDADHGYRVQQGGLDGDAVAAVHVFQSTRIRLAFIPGLYFILAKRPNLTSLTRKFPLDNPHLDMPTIDRSPN